MHLRRVLQPLPAEGINPRRENGDGSAVAALHAAPPVPPMAFWGCQSLVAAPQLLSCTIYSLGCGGGGTARSPQSITRSLRSTAAAQPRGPFCLISQMILFSFFFLFFFFFPPHFQGNRRPHVECAGREGSPAPCSHCLLWSVLPSSRDSGALPAVGCSHFGTSQI